MKNVIDVEEYRDKLRDSAKFFKSNWVQFGELLTKVASEKLWEKWGFRSFEDYCRTEIRIKKNTAMKLTNAYFFVTKEDPDIYRHADMEGGLELDTVNFLQRARHDENCSADIYDELKESALEKGQSGTTLARKFKKLTKLDKESPVEEFYEQNLKLINRLQQRLNPLENVPVKFKEYLMEMEAYFKSDQEENG